MSDSAVEDFQWLSNEIVADGGDATICTATLLSGVSDEDLVALFRAQPGADYRAIAGEAAAIDSADPRAAGVLHRLRGRVAAVAAIDFFEAPEKRAAERALRDAEARLAPEIPRDAASTAANSDAPRNAVWVTRKGVFIDRIASAWLIRRFIDPGARFRFVAPSDYRRAPGEIRFDMYRGEFTHAGDLCTFETLVAHFQPDDAPLRAIGEIVHDIDCKDDKFSRGETAGIAAVVHGIALSTDDDDERLRQGALVFDGLYERLRKTG
jgi:hypothetical protein